MKWTEMVAYSSLALLLGAQPSIEWQTVTASRLESHLRVPGKVVPREGALSIESARVSGRITSILKHEGEAVEPGTPLFDIASAECVSLLEEERVGKERTMPDMLEASKRREEQLGLRVSRGECALLATHQGILTKRQVELGTAFNVGDALGMILDASNLGIDLDIPERDLAGVRIGQRVDVELASDPGVVIHTAIEQILPTIDPLTRTSKARLAVHDLPRHTRVDALAFAQVDVPHVQTIFNIPTTALVFSHNQQYVVKAQGDHQVAVPVDVLDETSDMSSIMPHRAGELLPKDRLATRGAIFLFNAIAPADS